MFHDIQKHYRKNPIHTLQLAVGSMLTSAGSLILLTPFFIPVYLPVYFLGVSLLFNGLICLAGHDIYNVLKEGNEFTTLGGILILESFAVIIRSTFAPVALGWALCELYLAIYVPLLMFIDRPDFITSDLAYILHLPFCIIAIALICASPEACILTTLTGFAFGICLSTSSSPHDTSSSPDNDRYGNNDNYDSSNSYADSSSSTWDSTDWQNTSISYT